MGIFDAGRDNLAGIGWDETIAYSRDGVAIASALKAKLGRSYDSTAEAAGWWDGISSRSARRDFIVKASELGVTPQVRDVVTWGGRDWCVSEPAGEPCWANHDRVGKTIRIHTELVAETEQETNE